MSKMMKGKVVLVTGGTGSIGSEIVRQSLNEGASKVVVFSRDEVKHFMMRKKFSNTRLETIVGDVRDLSSIEQAFYRFNIDILYHAAAMKHVVMCEDFPLEVVKTNILGTQNVVDLALKYAIPRVVTISTDKAANSANVMGACKFIAERITLNANRVARHEQSFSCVRFGNVANSRGSVIPVYVESLLNNKPLEVTDPEVTRFIMAISEAVKLVLKATGYMRGGEIFILKMKAFKLGDLVDVIVNRIAPNLKIAKEDVKVINSGLVTGEKLHEDLMSDMEAPRLYQLKDMYVLLPDNNINGKYAALTKARFSRYSSYDTELLSKDEIEQIIQKYIEERTLIR